MSRGWCKRFPGSRARSAVRPELKPSTACPTTRLRYRPCWEGWSREHPSSSMNIKGKSFRMRALEGEEVTSML
jgi:hypothetical protein